MIGFVSWQLPKEIDLTKSWCFVDVKREMELGLIGYCHLFCGTEVV